jgi:hypothetical protein
VRAGCDNRAAVLGGVGIDRQHHVDGRHVTIHVTREVHVKGVLEAACVALGGRQDEAVLEVQDRRRRDRGIHNREHLRELLSSRRKCSS